MVMNATPVERAAETINLAIREFGDSLVLLTSFQREGVVLLDLLMQSAPGVRVMTIDTGRLPEATSTMIREVEVRYGIQVHRILPEPAEVTAMVDVHGPDLFRNSVAQRMLCCNIRKIRPLGRAMQDVNGYLTGLRRGQNESRANVPVFDRSANPVRVSPLAEWTPEDVVEYTASHNLPIHPLYELGYRSIGCDPCTRAVHAGEDERAGRWWWEQDAAKECGIHFSPDGKAERTVDVLLRDLLSRRQTA